MLPVHVVNVINTRRACTQQLQYSVCLVVCYQSTVSFHIIYYDNNNNYYDSIMF